LPPPSVLPPASVGPQAATQPQKPRPLYIPRDVEAFLRAAGLPIPTEKSVLDAIMAAMGAAKMAAQQANPGNQRQPQQQQPSQNQPQQSQQPGQQNPQQGQQQPQQPRLSREERRQQHMQMRQQQREQRRQQNQQNNQQNPQNQGDGQQAGNGEQQAQPGQQQQPRPPKVEEPVELVEAEGYCEISGKGFGFIRDPKRHFQPNPMDVFVTPEVVKRFGVKDGHWLKVEAKKNSRGMQINKLLEVNGQPPENVKMWPSFEDLTTISPIEHIKLETVTDRATTRIMDLLTPIGKGQRGLIVAPPRTGKTTLLHHIADAVGKNHPDMHLMILLVDERPEEVTDFRRNLPNAELWASSNDMDVKSHTRIATLAIERARRLVESGKDVFILLDSITRLGRAFNNAIAGGGRTMSGGVDSRALENPRKFFAAARNTEEAGSLTIVATALIDTGSRMDELIFQEFKGTGNSEVVLDRKISDMRIYPAIDIFQSGTRREELILPADQLNKINVIRRGLAGHKPIEAIERVLSFVKRFPTNEALLREIPG
jgi:transcription termination factor Rho